MSDVGDIQRRSDFVDKFARGLGGEHISYDRNGAPQKSFAVYIGGNPATNGTWRLILDPVAPNEDLLIQRLEVGVWVTKQTITP